MTAPDAPAVGAVDVSVFLVELALLAAFAVAGAALGSGASAVLLAILLPFVTAAVWGVWLAPRTSRRLPYPARLVAKLALVLVASALLAASGAMAWAVAFLIIGGGLVAFAEITAAHRS